MSYGIQIRNEFGEDIVSGRTLYVRTRGTTSTLDPNRRSNFVFPSIYQGTPGIDRLTYSGIVGPRVLTTGAARPFSIQYAAVSGFEQINGENTGLNQPVPTADVGDMIFVELGASGIVWGGQVAVTDPAQTVGSYGYVYRVGDGALDYMVASLSPGAPVGTHGMQVRNAAGELELDSRFEQLAIKDHVIIAKDDVLGVLQTGTPFDIALRQPVPNAKVHVSSYAQVWIGGVGNGRTGWVALKQLDASTLRLELIAESGYAYQSPPSQFGYTSDVVVILAE